MKSTKGANVTLMSLNSSQWKVWTLNTEECLALYWNKICKKKSKTLFSVQQTTLTTKDLKKFKNQNRNVLHFTSSIMIPIKHKQITQFLLKRSQKNLKRLLIWAKHSPDNLCKTFKIKLIHQSKTLSIIMSQVTFKKGKKANPLTSTKS